METIKITVKVDVFKGISMSSNGDISTVSYYAPIEGTKEEFISQFKEECALADRKFLKFVKVRTEKRHYEIDLKSLGTKEYTLD